MNQVIQSSAVSIDDFIAQGNYACTEDIFDNLASLINESPTPTVYSKEIEPKLQEWIEEGQKLPSVGKNLDAIVLLGGVQKIVQTPEQINQIEMKVSEIVEKEALLEREPIRVFELAGYLCHPQDVNSDMIYFDILNQVISSDQNVDGKYLNCTDAELNENVLASSLSEVQYIVNATYDMSTRKLIESCKYSGGHVLDVYSTDYYVNVKEIKTDTVIAETIVKNEQHQDCEMVRSFHSRTVQYYLPPDGEEISTWLLSLELP